MGNKKSEIEVKTSLLKEPLNPLDPVVVIDPEFNKKFIMKEYDDPNVTSMPSQNSNSLNDDAINIPVIRLNNIVLNDNQIDYVKIFFNGFLPTVHLSIKDTENVIRICDTPGFDNEINIVITTEINGYYKKISLLFYIIDFKIFDDYISYDGLFKLQSINTHMFKQIGKGKLNTFNLLKEIAIENKLGFAATEKCEDIKDERYRLIKGKTYYDFILDQINLSGLDETSIFDAWIDIFGYIVMVNVHHIMTQKIEPEQLMIYTMAGQKMNLNDDSLKVKGVQVQRTLTNNKINDANYNLLFEHYEPIIDNSNIYNNGALNTNFYMNSPCKENLIQTEQIQLIENSIDGVSGSNNYEFSKMKFLGIEFSDTPILFKRNINKRYFEKLRAKQIKLELSNYNLGLERGTLVNIIFKEYNDSVIKTFSNNNNIEMNGKGVINPYSSGMYYIDSMEFEYKTENHKIQQYLYLIKKSADNKPLNNSIGPNLLEENS